MTTDDVLAARLVDWLHRLMPRGPRLDRLTGDLRAFAGRVTPVTAESVRALQECAQVHARHLELIFDPAGAGTPDDAAPGWPAPHPGRVRARAAGFTEVRRADEVCVMRVDSLEAYPLAQPYLDAAFALAAGADRLILDLRGNGGGEPATLAAIAGRLLEPDTRPLSEVVYRDRRRQWWPRDPAPGDRFTGDVDVLVSAHTYSSAEALAYHLRVRDRVTVLGETTRGAADHVTPVRLSGQVLALVPEATVIDGVTGGNWEGTGVVPDVPCGAADALDVARHRHGDGRTG